MSSRPINVFIDADSIVYRDGYMCENHTWECIYEDPEGQLHQQIFDCADARNKWEKEHPSMTNLERIKHVTPSTMAIVLGTVKNSIHGIFHAVKNEYDREPILHLFIGGPGNFREKIATVKEYKGNRPDDKPFHYQNIRDYLTQYWKAEVVHGCEAEDEVSIQARRLPEEDVVIAAIDKDCDQIPGRRYDYTKKIHYNISEFEAWRWAWVQTLSGDSTDNIPGAFRCGVKGAEKLIDDWVKEWEVKGNPSSVSLDEYLWKKVCEEYEQAKSRETEKMKCPYIDRDSKEVALEMARLVRLQQYPNQLWTPPGQPDELVEFDDHEED